MRFRFFGSARAFRASSRSRASSRLSSRIRSSTGTTATRSFPLRCTTRRSFPNAARLTIAENSFRASVVVRRVTLYPVASAHGTGISTRGIEERTAYCVHFVHNETFCQEIRRLGSGSVCSCSLCNLGLAGDLNHAEEVAIGIFQHDEVISGFIPPGIASGADLD